MAAEEEELERRTKAVLRSITQNWPRAICPPGYQGAGGGGLSVLRLVRRGCHRLAWQGCYLNAVRLWSDRMNAPSRVRNRNLASTSAPSSASQAARSSPHSRWAWAVVSRSPGISMYSP